MCTTEGAGLLHVLAEMIRRILIILLACFVFASVVFFPLATDAPLSASEQAKLRDFYTSAYRQVDTAEDKTDGRYIQIAEAEAQAYNILGRVSAFVHEYGLESKKILDIGSGRGYLQDVAQDYTGLDISPSVRRFYHKPFAIASALSCHFPIISSMRHGRSGCSNTCRIRKQRWWKRGES